MPYKSRSDALGVPIEGHLKQLRIAFLRAFPIPAAGRFEDLLAAIDTSEGPSQLVDDASKEN